MSLLGAAVILGLFCLSAVFSGSETGVYSVSHVQLDAAARHGSWSARLLRWLMRSDATLLILLLVGNNLAIELLTHRGEALIPADLPPWAHEIFVTLVLTPLVFFLAELLPKDLFRRRPMGLLVLTSPVLLTSYFLFLPLVLPLRGLTLLLERLMGIRDADVSRLLRRRDLQAILEEGTRSGAIPTEARALARNVLSLRETEIRDVLVPWTRVRRLSLTPEDPAAARADAEKADFTRLPVTGPPDSGGEVLGYVHQLDVLSSQDPIESLLRPLTSLPPSTPLDRALRLLRDGGQRIALVGTPSDPLGILTLTDLLGELARESLPRERGSRNLAATQSDR